MKSWAIDVLGDLAGPGAGRWPFSFVVDGMPSAEFFPRAAVTRSTEPLSDGKERTNIAIEDKFPGLVVTCSVVRYTDFPAVEWTLHFSNPGPEPSPLISDIRALDLAVPVSRDQAKMTLRAARGGVCTIEDFEPLSLEATEDQPVRLHPRGGRSSNGYLPFFNVDAEDYGVVVAVGWSGQWCADLTLESPSTARLRADIAETRLRLQPDESIRTARILLVFWEGDRIGGHNTMRRLIRRHCTPLLDGQKPLPPVQCNTWFPVGDNGGNANEQNQVELLRAYAPLGIEYLVMDAGWYGETAAWPDNVGSWTPRQDAFPNGLKPIGDAAREAGIQFGMWFEPERVRPGRELDREHPEWLITLEGQDNRLLNLGLPEVQSWFVELVSRYVDEVPLGYFRHDFNMDPLPYWKEADTPDRVGMTEIRYIEGLYRIWDDLLARYPALMVEGCSSGGRRMDLESISRCHTYWKSDLFGVCHGDQGHVHGASLYLPGNYLNTPLFSPGGEGYAAPHYLDRNTLDGRLGFDDPYAFRSVLGGALCLGWDPRLPAFDRELATRWVEQFKRLRHLVVGDFYPLTPHSTGPEDWIACQFHREDAGEGMVILFRREQSESASVEIAFQGVQADQTYEVSVEDRGERKRLSGADLRRPMEVTIDRAPGSELIRYRQA